MSRQSFQSIKIRTVDTDVVVIAIVLFPRINLNKLWIQFGTGTNKVFYPVHLICNNPGSEKCKALLFFHAITGCDQVSYFNMCKKKVALKTWKSYPEVTDKFINLCNLPSKEFDDLAFPIIERFTALMYKRTTNAITVNKARREMFVKYQ